MRRTALIPFLVLALVAMPTRAEDAADALAAGIAAYDAEEFERARELLAPLAEDGAPRALYLMGDMHWAGRGGGRTSRSLYLPGGGASDWVFVPLWARGSKE